MNDTFFLIAVIMSVVGTAAYMIYCIMEMPEYIYIGIITLINAIGTVGLYVSYQKYYKNVMKGLIGFTLMGLLPLTVTCAFPVEPELEVYTALSLCNLIVVIELSLNHFVINSDRYSKSIYVRINQVLILVMFIMYLAMAAAWIMEAVGGLPILYMTGIPLASFGVSATIVCVDSRLDAYRVEREAAGWTAEHGYPEGYVAEEKR